VSTQEYYRPKSLAEATSMLAGEAQGSLILAGGTLAMPLINDGLSMPEKVKQKIILVVQYVKCI
jgi:CO/xanthine dehydrogenase FAD-binding subunit